MPSRLKAICRLPTRLWTSIMPRRKRSMTLTRYVNSVMLLLAAACTTYPGKGDARLESIYVFAGTDGAMAYSIDKSGANLPDEYAPWRFE